MTTNTEADDFSGVEILEKDANLIEVGNDEKEPVSDLDDARSAIYAKHAEKRKEEMAIAAELPDDEITIKVNGKERSVSRDKIDAAGGVEAYQKNAAASELLNHASAEARRVRDANEDLLRRQRDLEEREQRFSQAQAVPPVQHTEPPAQDADALKAVARQYHEAVLDGDMDLADDLFIKITAAQKATAVNPDEIANRAVQRAKEVLTADKRLEAANKFEADRVEAVNEFSTKYKDLDSNAAARKMVDAQTNEVYREHPDWDAKAIIDEAARRTREFIKEISPSSASDKQAAKREIVQIRSGSARTATRPAPKPQTKSDYVGQLRKSRGLD